MLDSSFGNISNSTNQVQFGMPSMFSPLTSSSSGSLLGSLGNGDFIQTSSSGMSSSTGQQLMREELLLLQEIMMLLELMAQMVSDSSQGGQSSQAGASDTPPSSAPAASSPPSLGYQPQRAQAHPPSPPPAGTKPGTSKSIGGVAEVPDTPAPAAGNPKPASVISGTPGTTPSSGVTELGGGADPSIVQFQGQYWLAQANNGQQITISHSASLQDLISNPQRSTITVNDPNYHAEAPSLAVVTDSDGQKKLSLTVSDSANNTMRAFMINNPNDPAGSAVDEGNIPGLTGYDSQYFTLPNGKSYLAYSNYKSIELVQMANPWTPVSQPSTISSATLPWENKEGSLNEAPAIVVSGNTINLVYSTNRYNSSNYESGLITAPLNSDPLNPNSWTKDPNPILATGNGIVGPGSGTFFNDSSGQTKFAFSSLAPDGSRIIDVMNVGFDASGKVIL